MSPKIIKSLSRREFTGLTTRVILGLSGLLGLKMFVDYLGYQSDPPKPNQVDLGPAGNYPLESRTVIAKAQAILVHSKQGFLAYSLICPHLGCIVQEDPKGFTCPCHGSRFETSGALIQGPANRGLKLLTLEETPSGNLILHLE